MGIQKWEIRYSLLLLLCLIHPAQMQQETCTTNAARNKTCQNAGGYEQEIDANGACLSSSCFGTRTRAMYENVILKMSELTPELKRSGEFPNQVGVPFNLTCMAWATYSKGLNNVRVTSESSPVLPEPDTWKRIYILNGQTIVSVAVVSILKMALIGSRHKQNVSCGMEFMQGSASEEEKNRNAFDVLYAFAQSPPLIQGPKQVEAGALHKWDCVTEEVTVDKPAQFMLTMSTNPAIPHPPTQDENYETLGSSDNPLSFKVTKSMRFTVPPSFRPAFFILCKGENVALGDGRKVEMTAPLFRVKVVTRPYDLSSIFTIVGVSFGFGGFTLGTALVIFYWRKKKAEETKGRRP